MQNNIDGNRQEINNYSASETKDIPTLNLSDAKQTELRSHFDVVRKLGYLSNINALVSISEVKY